MGNSMNTCESSKQHYGIWSLASFSRWHGRRGSPHAHSCTGFRWLGASMKAWSLKRGSVAQRIVLVDVNLATKTQQYPERLEVCSQVRSIPSRRSSLPANLLLRRSVQALPTTQSACNVSAEQQESATPPGLCRIDAG